jgi:uncharacterized RDD family membrane protein YckC
MASATLNTLPIRTPEGVTFSLTLAGPTSRFLAFLVDLCCISALAEVAARISQVLGAVGADFGAALRVLLYFAITIGYGIACEWYWRGQTVGKRMLRLRVVDRQGLRMQPSQIITRNLLRFADGLPAFYLLGGLTSLLNRQGQRLGDIAASTVVVRTAELRQPDLDQMSKGRFNSLARYPHLAARLRQRVAPKTASVALQALLRRDQFDPAARIELFGEMAAYFRELVEFPAEAIEQLADEPYVRNVVEILFQTRAVSGSASRKRL